MKYKIFNFKGVFSVFKGYFCMTLSIPYPALSQIWYGKKSLNFGGKFVYQTNDLYKQLEQDRNYRRKNIIIFFTAVHVFSVKLPDWCDILKMAFNIFLCTN